MNFKGIILAGGRGTRLSPITDVYNKYLCPVYDKLMIEYSIFSLKKAGITDIAIVLGTKSAGETIDYLKSGAKYGVHFTYFYQDEPLGVPHALYQAKKWAADSNVVVLCADNIIYDDLKKFLIYYETEMKNKGGFITVKKIHDTKQLQRFAVLELDEKTGQVMKLVEKPKNPPSYLAFCGVQIYDKNVWPIIETLKPSGRGEYEIVDVLNTYINKKEFGYDFLEESWFDCGDKDALFEAQQYAYLRASLKDSNL